MLGMANLFTSGPLSLTLTSEKRCSLGSALEASVSASRPLPYSLHQDSPVSVLELNLSRSGGTMEEEVSPEEGTVGTWSHCGNRASHNAHLHSFAMNEGPYTDIQCLGTENTS